LERSGPAGGLAPNKVSKENESSPHDYSILICASLELRQKKGPEVDFEGREFFPGARASRPLRQ
jgi:hypothetical protein